MYTVSSHRKFGVAFMLSAALLAPARWVHAQGDSLRLSRTEAQERALAHSGELARRSTASVEARRLQRAPYPHLPDVTFGIEGTPAPWSSGEYRRRVSLEQQIDLRGERRGRRRVGSATSALAEREFGERAQEIAAAVDEVFSRHLVARRKVAFLDPLRERARTLRAKAEEARRRESLAGFDARLLRAEALGLEADWVDARRELEVAASELRTWLALAQDSAIDLEDDLDERPWQCEAESAMTLVSHRRVAVARAAAAESLAMSRLALEQRLGRVNPTLGISASRDRGRLESPSGAIVNDATFVGLELRVPLPVFGVNPLGVAEARLELERVRAERAALEREVRQEVLATCAALRSVEEERALRREAAESAGRDLQLIESAYQDGRIPLDEYLTLRDRLVRQEIGLLDAQAAVEGERSRLVRATGVPRTELSRRFGGVR